MARNNSAGLTRDIELLEAMVGHAEAGPSALGVSGLARATGRDKAQVSRALSTLVAAGIVERDTVTRAHRPGPRLFALAARSSHGTLVTAARPVLRDVALRTEESVYLCTMQGDTVLTLVAQVGVAGFRGAGWEGRIVSAATTSAGRALLTGWTDDGVRRLVATERERAATAAEAHGDTGGFGIATPDADTLVAAVQRAREVGYATADEEFEPGLVGASAPVRGADGSVVAAVNVVGPKRRLGQRLHSAGSVVVEAASTIGAALG